MVESQASAAEERVFAILNDLKLTLIDSHRKAGQLFKTTLLKAIECHATTPTRAHHKHYNRVLINCCLQQTTR